MLHRTLAMYANAFSGLNRDVWLLSLVLFINRAGTMVIPFLTIYLTGQKGFTLEEAGFILSLFGVGSVLGSFVGGWLTDRIGHYPVQFWTLIFSGMGFIALGYAETFEEFGVIIFLTSTIGDAFRPANQASVASYSHPERRTRSFALMRLAINLGMGTGPALGGLLSQTLGYEWLFIMDGLTCLLSALCLRLFLKPKPVKALEVTIEASPAPPPAERSPYRDGVYLAFVSFTLIFAIGFMQLFNTLPVYLKTFFEYSEFQVGLLITLNAIVIVALEMPLVAELESKFSKLGIIAIGNILIALGYGCFSLGLTWVAIPFLYILFLTMGEMLSLPFASAFALERSGERNRGQYMGLYSMGFSIGLIIAPTFGMYIAGHWGFNALWAILALMGTLAGIGFWLLGHIVHSRSQKLARTPS